MILTKVVIIYLSISWTGKLRCDGNVLILSFSLSVIEDRSLLQVNVYFVTSADKCDYCG